MKAPALISFLEFCITKRLPLMITGIPGIGKTDVAHQATHNVKADMIVSHPVVNDPTDYKGLPFAEAGGESAKFLPYGELNALITAKKPTVFFLDDLGQAPASVQAAAMQLILARKINGHAVSDNVTFVAATNRRADMAGVSGILEPVKSRFASIVELEVDVESWVQWGIQKGKMPVELLAFIRFKPDMLTQFTPTKEIKNSPSPRTIAHVGEFQREGLHVDLEHEVFTGAAGEGFATEYIAFLKMYRSMPDLDKIIANPKQAEVPREPSILYGLAGALAAKATTKNVANIFTYLNRLPGELSVVCAKDMKARDIQLLQTEAFIKWGTENAAIII